MKPNLSLIGTWVSELFVESSESTPACIWHVIDERTYVVDQYSDMGRVITWYQYWLEPEAILRFPLSASTRSMFKAAVRMPLLVESDCIILDGHRFISAEGFPAPERMDHFPGIRPDENGRSIPCVFKASLQDYFPDPPMEVQQSHLIP